MPVSDEKQATLARARAWLEGDATPQSIRYAAIDLRVIMEMLTYEKLVAAADVIPHSVLKTWQPPQAVKALLEFQPMADQTFEMHIGAKPADTPHDEQDWVLMGDHHALTVAWLRKNYNSAGSMVHAPNPLSKPSSYERNKASLLKMAEELEAALSSTIKNFTERGGYTFTCSVCNTFVVRNADAMRRGALAICPKAECGAEYMLAPSTEPADVVLLTTPLNCLECKSRFEVPRKKVQLDARLKCPHCAVIFQIAQLEQRWSGVRVGDAAQGLEVHRATEGS